VNPWPGSLHNLFQIEPSGKRTKTIQDYTQDSDCLDENKENNPTRKRVRRMRQPDEEKAEEADEDDADYAKKKKKKTNHQLI